MVLYVQADAVRTMRRAQWFLISLPILGGNGLVGEEDGLRHLRPAKSTCRRSRLVGGVKN